MNCRFYFLHGGWIEDSSFSVVFSTIVSISIKFVNRACTKIEHAQKSNMALLSFKIYVKTRTPNVKYDSTFRIDLRERSAMFDLCACLIFRTVGNIINFKDEYLP